MMTAKQKLDLMRTAEMSPGVAFLNALELLRHEVDALVTEKLKSIEANLPERVVLKHVEKLKGDKGDKPVVGVDFPAPKDGYTPKKGIDYVDGKTPQKFVDYMTQEEIDAIIQSVTPQKGVHYLTQAEIDRIVTAIHSMIRPATDGITPRAGVDYPTHEQIKKIIEDSLPKQINVEEMMKQLTPMIASQIDSKVRKGSKGKKYLHGGGGLSLMTISGGLITGNIDGNNKTFVFQSAPSIVIVDQGRTMQRVSADGEVNWTGTTTIVLEIAPRYDIFGI